MNKIEFFNDVMSIHDKNNAKYNEIVADLVLSTHTHAFNVYYSLFNIIEEIFKKVSPYEFVIDIKDEEDNETPSLNSFTIQAKTTKIAKEIYAFLLDNCTVLGTNNYLAELEYDAPNEDKVINIRITNIKFAINIANCQRINFDELEEV